MADIKYIISVDEKGAIKAIQSFDKALEDVKKTTENKTKPALVGLWKQFAVGAIAADAAKKAIDFIKGSIGGIFTEAIAAEEAQNRLAVALGSTGRTVDAMLPGMIAFANKMAITTTRTDEEVLAAQALLVQLTSLNRDGLDRATQGAIGLAYVMGTDLNTAAMNVAKATEGNFMALQRLIPSLRDAKTDSEKMAMVNNELAKYYKSATGETDTFGGALKQLKKAWKEVQEAVGLAVIENDKINGLINDIKDALIDFVASGKAAEMGQSIIDALRGVIDFIKNDFLPVVGFIAKGVQFAIDEIKNTSSVMREEGIKSKEILQGILDKLILLDAGTGDYEVDIANLSIALHGHNVKLDEVKRKISETGDASRKAGDAIKLQLLPPFRDLSNVIGGINLREYLGGLKDMPGYFNAILPPARDMRDVLKQATGLIYDMPMTAKGATKDIGDYFEGLYNDIARGLGDTIEKWMSGLTTFKDFMKGIWDEIKAAFFRMIGEILADAVLGQFKKFFASIGLMGQQAGTTAGTGLSSGISAGAAAALNAIAMVAGAFTAFYGLISWLSSKIMKLTADMRSEFDRAYEDMMAKAGIIVAPPLGRKRSPLETEPGQFGLDRMVSRPTLFLAGEAGPERVMIKPQGRAAKNAETYVINIYLDGQKIGQKTIRDVKRAGQLGRLTLPAKVIT